MEQVVSWKALPDGELRDISAFIEHLIAKVGSRVGHPFRLIKRQFGYTKVRYRGLAKNGAHLNRTVRLVKFVDGVQAMTGDDRQGVSEERKERSFAASSGLKWPARANTCESECGSR